MEWKQIWENEKYFYVVKFPLSFISFYFILCNIYGLFYLLIYLKNNFK